MNNLISSIPFSTGCEIIATHPCGLVAINKKAGRASHPNAKMSKNDKPPMIRAHYNLKEECYSWEDQSQQKHKLYLINRLDSPTSGVILASTNLEVAELAKEQFKLQNVDKVYMAIAIGKLIPSFGLWKDRITITKKSNFVRAQKGGEKNVRIAITKYKVETFDENSLNLSLLRLEPQTGLTHQLRVQCANHHHPILGDATYGDFSANKRIKAKTKISRLFLHCVATSLKFTLNGEDIDFQATAPLPESFQKIIRFNYNKNQK